ncbi:COMM domain-containing protein 10 [Sabethes cyaneus]|uniref:COMM domain-containing protein 10 n=1 Tax=Sabethes cyaneus TaxID=53552 RepID=UPI00221E360C|nr:COMM domain-containing protein 10 [Sabethes cyaneus]
MSRQLTWFRVTESLTRGAAVCNERLSDECFSTIVEYLFKTIDNTADNVVEYAEDDLTNIHQESSQLSEKEFQLVLQTLTYLVKRSLKFMLKPSALQGDLQRELALDDTKCNIFVKYWIQSTKIILDSLELKQDGSSVGKSNQLEDVSWKVRAQLSSEPRQKDKLALGQLELKTTSKTINLELNSDEIVKFYEQLERIQVELDALSAKS